MGATVGYRSAEITARHTTITKDAPAMEESLAFISQSMCTDVCGSLVVRVNVNVSCNSKNWSPEEIEVR